MTTIQANSPLLLTRIFYTLCAEFWDQQTVDEWAALMVATPDGQQRHCLLGCDEYLYEVQAGHP